MLILAAISVGSGAGGQQTKSSATGSTADFRTVNSGVMRFEIDPTADPAPPPPASGNQPLLSFMTTELESVPALPADETADVEEQNVLDEPNADLRFGAESVRISVSDGPGWSRPGPGQPLSPFERKQTEELYDRVLDLDPDGQNRDLIDRVRTSVTETEIGVDVTDERWITVKDRIRITWGGLIQGDLVNWLNDQDFLGQPNYFEFRRLRLTAVGEGYGVYDYELTLEFAPEANLEGEVIGNRVDLGGFGVEVKDAYVGIRDNPYVGYLRLGHFRVPQGMSQLTSARNQTFIERPLPHIFAPGREAGIGAYNSSSDYQVNWAYGAFIYEMDEAEHAIEDDSHGMRLAARVAWTPYYDDLTQGRYLVHTGLSFSYNRPRAIDDPNDLIPEFRPVRFESQPEIHRGDDLIDTGDINTEEYNVLDLEFAWRHGPFRIESELAYASLNQLGSGSTDLYGAYVLASYFLTGEQREYNTAGQGVYDRSPAVFGSIVPFENFWLVNTSTGQAAGWGAWEIAFRWSILDFPEVSGQRLNNLTSGINWYWNPQTRVMFNWIHTMAHNSPASTLVDADGDVVSMRFEVAF